MSPGDAFLKVCRTTSGMIQSGVVSLAPHMRVANAMLGSETVGGSRRLRSFFVSAPALCCPFTCVWLKGPKRPDS